jgi:tetratricopeptide (TPR) repeat protein
MAKNSNRINKIEAVPDPNTLTPQSSAEYLERGWLFYSHQKFEQAEADFRQVLRQESENPDAWYALGLVLKALGKGPQAIDAFSRVEQTISSIEDRQRAVIIFRLLHGQINQIRTGNWNMEDEIWKLNH